MKVTQYVVTHKDCEHLKNKTYIGVGGNELKDVLIYDYIGDNISNKNKNYCELTALYWIYKNDKTSEIISFEHYRRMFYKGLRINYLNKKDIEKIFNKDYDIILPKENTTDIFHKNNIYKLYSLDHYKEDLDLCREAISNLYPEYLSSFDNVIYGFKMTYFNMFITTKELLDNYAKWIFNVFDYVENIIDLKGRTDYQKRVFGFLSERLFNVWLKHQNLKIKRMKVTFEGHHEITWRSKEIIEFIKHGIIRK